MTNMEEYYAKYDTLHVFAGVLGMSVTTYDRDNIRVGQLTGNGVALTIDAVRSRYSQRYSMGSPAEGKRLCGAIYLRNSLAKVCCNLVNMGTSTHDNTLVRSCDECNLISKQMYAISHGNHDVNLKAAARYAYTHLNWSVLHSDKYIRCFMDNGHQTAAIFESTDLRRSRQCGSTHEKCKEREKSHCVPIYYRAVYAEFIAGIYGIKPEWLKPEAPKTVAGAPVSSPAPEPKPETPEPVAVAAPLSTAPEQKTPEPVAVATPLSTAPEQTPKPSIVEALPFIPKPKAFIVGAQPFSPKPTPKTLSVGVPSFIPKPTNFIVGAQSFSPKPKPKTLNPNSASFESEPQYHESEFQHTDPEYECFDQATESERYEPEFQYSDPDSQYFNQAAAPCGYSVGMKQVLVQGPNNTYFAHEVPVIQSNYSILPALRGGYRV